MAGARLRSHDDGVRDDTHVGAMRGNYEIVLQVEEHCDGVLAASGGLSDDDVERIVRSAVTLHECGHDPAARRVPQVVDHALGIEPTLYVVRMPERHRAVISVDADEVFGRLVVTLWSYTPHHELHRALEGLVEALYGRYLRQRGEAAYGGEGAE